MTAANLAWVAGASGLVGRELLAQLDSESDTQVIALVRRPLSGVPPSPRRRDVVVDLHRLGPLPGPRRVFIALGTTMAQAGSQTAFRAVDFDAVVAVARSARAAGASHCGVVSALGASTRSSVFYNRVKGEAEDALKALGFERLVIARPSLLDGERERLDQPRRSGEAWTLRLTRPLGALIPAAWRPIQADRVARALRVALDQAGAPVQVLESAALQRLGAP
jgi:uncharacterized protein YbjT (DUF2867 family)